MTLKPDKAWHIPQEYGSLDYRGALVLDIGAEYGCTAEFFLERGARQVIACEKNPDWRARLEEWAEGKPVTVHGEITAANLPDIFSGCAPDTVKVDCEGCESLLLDMPDHLLRGPKAWIMETHTLDLYRAFTKLFGRLGYTVEMVRDFGDTPNKAGQVCKVFKATR